MTTPIKQAAEHLRQAEANGQPCAPVRSLLPADDIAAAYEVQKVNAQIAVASGRRISGKKIGLTSAAVQKQLRVNQPDYGVLFADMEVPSGSSISYGQVLQPKVEAEIALVIGKELRHEDTTLAELIASVEFVVPALEIVGSRIANWDITIVDTIADNASCGAYVLGNRPVKLADVDLGLCGMALFSRGEPLSVGAGVACLGHPLNAALWLARTMARVEQPLVPGDVVLTGALGPMLSVVAGETYEARINGVGNVSVHFRAAA
ncbi:2-keto-4-pentenoate hydratase [Novosphingobium humi]|uniref:Fumarylacetoacetate hydrolase family protein n=1 Tax=Novosphingobium humi TaxID=2282397 RepID=A0ABY7U0T8_9SPHN|nr:fumarylacetoacetate hydrolase family protein [Novosphingobium humi]WCT79142.1 fumarylacetoacetate hydrolase family protein [Novosphingobium humi]